MRFESESMKLYEWEGHYVVSRARDGAEAALILALCDNPENWREDGSYTLADLTNDPEAHELIRRVADNEPVTFDTSCLPSRVTEALGLREPEQTEVSVSLTASAKFWADLAGHGYLADING